MTATVAALRNLGPAMARMLAEVDIPDAVTLRNGPIDAYRRLKFRFGSCVNIVALYALHGALIDCDWRALDEEAKDRLRLEGESIRSALKVRT